MTTNSCDYQFVHQGIFLLLPVYINHYCLYAY